MQCDTFKDPAAWEAVHRLDYETSGCMLVARKEAVPVMREAFKKREVDKWYLAGASRALPPAAESGTRNGYVGGRYRSSKKVSYLAAAGQEESVLKRQFHSLQRAKHDIEPASAELSELARERLGFRGILYDLKLITGARHQIRAFFAAYRAPLEGDPVYGEAHEGARLELHAYRLRFADPFAEGETVDVRSPT